MMIERTLTGLRGQHIPPARAKELGQLGYMQWLGALPGHSSYEYEAVRAYLDVAMYIRTDPAVAEFCFLICESLRFPLQPLDLGMPKPRRRGGARERRQQV
ncbi:hypothetical protein [Thalassococcus lentus]|uniref:Uncharacterized protein n=1 Tax=Thalassococcus lentus TaxID=1210524 RepID=A0ABT4XTR8_9RHOB|nr:hypothetical protein [Thalassococcus lentus]MDA7425326.1 hypothetical protein [Thalassococcus lentus]